MYTLNICHLYPDLLNLYGDRGNVIALEKRAKWRGIDVNVINISLGDSFIPEQYDIIFLGGGQDYEQEIIQKDILEQKGTEIKNAVHNGKVFLCICGGYQLMGHYYRTWEGREIKFLGALDLWTIGSKDRMIGNTVYECEILSAYGSNITLVGFENHSGRTYLGSSVAPLAKVIVGFGNNGEDGFEGAIFKNVYCSYSHGSLLPKNPVLTDHLIYTALKQKYNNFGPLQPLDDELEQNAHNIMLRRITGKHKA